MDTNLPRRLYRSRSDRIIAGVAGGLAQYFDVDPVLVRLIWALTAVLTGGVVVVAYGLLWLILPEEHVARAQRPARNRSESPSQTDEVRAELGFVRLAEEVEATYRPRPTAAASAAPGAEPDVTSVDPITGEAGPAQGGYVSEPVTWREQRRHRRRVWAGAILVLLGVVLLLDNFGLLWWLNGRVLWPLVLIGLGALLLWRRVR